MIAVSIQQAIEDMRYDGEDKGPAWHLLRAIAHAPPLRNRAADALSGALSHIRELADLADDAARSPVERYRVKTARNFVTWAEQHTGVRS